MPFAAPLIFTVSRTRLQLDLTDDDQIIIKDANGLPLTIEKASEYILRAFLT
jgi:hypothetical protein